MSENYIVINGKRANLTEEQLEKLGIKPIQTAKYKVGDWVRVVANKSGRPVCNSYFDKVFQIECICSSNDYMREDDNGRIQAYGIGREYVVYEDELEPAEEKLKQDLFDIKACEGYYYVQFDGDVSCAFFNCDFDYKLMRVANACKDKELVRQRALHETLNRLLWRASVKAGELENPWNGDSLHYTIVYDTDCQDFAINHYRQVKNSVVHFPSSESALAAIENIVKPFVKEHPEFKW